MKRAASFLLSFVSVLIILAFIAYGIFWVYVSRQVAMTLDDIWSHQEKYLVTIAGAEPMATGFPAPPKFVFSGSITDRNGLVYASPEFIFQGFPIETQAITLKAPQGLDLSGPVFKATIHLDDLLLKTRIPSGFPNRFDYDTLSKWQKLGGTLPIENLHVARGSLSLDGEGYLNLDAQLQLAGMIKVKISGLDDLINELATNGTIGQKQALMGQSLINLMSHKDEATGISSINTSLTIQDGGIFIGPLRAASIPQWKWDNAIEPKLSSP